MRTFIISDNEPITVLVREALLREGQECPASNVSNLNQAIDRLTGEHPELIVFVLGTAMEPALAVAAQVHTMAHVPMLAVGPTGDSHLLLQALHAGVTDYLDIENLTLDLKASLARLEGEQNQLTAPARCLVFLGANGGSGSSTLAVNVATALAHNRGSILLMDLKLQTGDLAALLDLKPTHTLSDLCQNAARMDRIMLEHTLVRHGSGVYLLASPQRFGDIAHVTAEGIRQTLTLARTMFPYVVVDLDHSFAAEQLQVLRQADKVLLVMRLDFASLRNTQRFLDYLTDLGIDRQRVHVVVNRYGQAKEVPIAKAEGALGVKFFHYVPDDPWTVNRANNTGIPVIMDNPRAKIARSLTQLAASVNGQHG